MLGKVCGEVADAGCAQLIERGPHRGEVLVPDRHARGFEDALVPAAAARQRFLGEAALRDVACDVRGPHDPSVRAPDRRHGHGDIDEASVLRAAHRLEMVDLLATPQTREHLGFFVEPVGWNQD